MENLNNEGVLDEEVLSEEEIQDMINELHTDTEKIIAKSERVARALRRRGRDVGIVERSTGKLKEALRELRKWSWKGAAVGGAIGAFFARLGPIPGAIGVIAGLIIGGYIGEAFAVKFKELIDRISEVNVSIGMFRARVILNS